MEHSKLIKQLRTERKLSQRMLTDGISQRSTLSSFEQNNTRISFEIICLFLERMNVTLEEYEYILVDSKLSSKRKLAAQVAKSFSKPFKRDLAKELLDNYSSTEDFFYYSLYAQYYLVTAYQTPEVSKVEMNRIKKKIKKYLDSIETWGRFELVIFSNCLFIFEDNYIRFHFVESIQHMRLYHDSSNYSSDLLKFLINGLNLSYTRHSTQNINIFMTELEKINEDYDDVKTKMVLKIFKILIDRENGLDNSKEKIELQLALSVLDEDYWINYIDTHYR
ncbi:Rgg/GadR/MutR family transcriptional regulator [Enterococcus thailandicus]|uniref:Rgg/GadR/MutR family transcriptional regulator n=1 Tax=Enterococcus thailandicus TaxID=417368 RepID=UPI0022E4C43B|nr:Rgg/GadR/MutR family transcriptional regulator [Enterococcus thailandicus]